MVALCTKFSHKMAMVYLSLAVALQLQNIQIYQISSFKNTSGGQAVDINLGYEIDKNVISSHTWDGKKITTHYI